MQAGFCLPFRPAECITAFAAFLVYQYDPIVKRRQQEAFHLIEGGYLARPQTGALQLLEEPTVAICRHTLQDLLLEKYLTSNVLSRFELAWHDWDYDLPNLRRLTFPGSFDHAPRPFYIRQAQAMIKHAPNLRELTAPECGRWYGYEWPGGSMSYVVPNDIATMLWSTEATLCNLRKLSMSSIHGDELSELLARCPSLEDLECHSANAMFRAFDSKMLLKDAQSTLRRLCLSTTQPRDYSRVWRPYQAMMDFERVYFTALPCLEILEIDHTYLYHAGHFHPVPLSQWSDHLGGGLSLGLAEEDGPENSSDGSLDLDNWPPNPIAPFDVDDYDRQVYKRTTPENFLCRLPSTLRVLRAGFVWYWPPLYRDALALANQAPVRFKRLREVTFLVFFSPPADEADRLVSAFSSVGITANVCLVRPMPRGLFGRGLLPPRPGVSLEDL